MTKGDLYRIIATMSGSIRKDRQEGYSDPLWVLERALLAAEIWLLENGALDPEADR